MKIKVITLLIIIFSLTLFSKGKIVVDETNNIWCTIDSPNGSKIGKFDGKKWTNIDLPTDPVNVVYNMYWHENKLWIASLNGVFHFDGTNWGTYTDEPTYCLAFQKGNIWTGTNDIVRKNKRKFVSFSIDNIEVKALYLERGYHNFCTNFGIYKSSTPKAFVTKMYIKDQKNKSIDDIEMIGDTMYFIVDGMIKSLSSRGWKKTENRSNLLFNYKETLVSGSGDSFKVEKQKIPVNGLVIGIDKDSENYLWVYTNEKLYKWKESKIQEIKLPK